MFYHQIETRDGIVDDDSDDDSCNAGCYCCCCAAVAVVPIDIDDALVEPSDRASIPKHSTESWPARTSDGGVARNNTRHPHRHSSRRLLVGTPQWERPLPRRASIPKWIACMPRRC